MEYVDGPNAYAYVQDSPTSKTDSLGLSEEEVNEAYAEYLKYFETHAGPPIPQEIWYYSVYMPEVIECGRRSADKYEFAGKACYWVAGGITAVFTWFVAIPATLAATSGAGAAGVAAATANVTAGGVIVTGSTLGVGSAILEEEIDKCK